MKFFKPTLFLISFVMSSLVAYAASSYSINGNVVKVVNIASVESTSIRISTVVKGAAANAPYASRVVALNASKFQSWFKPQLGSLIKANVWWFAFAAAVESAGWAIDELKNEVTKPAIGGVGPYEVGYYYSSQEFGYGVFNGVSVDDVATQIMKYFANSGTYTCNSKYSYFACRYPMFSSEVNIFKNVCESGSSLASCTGQPAPSVPVSDADVYNAVAAQLALDPESAANAFTDPLTGRPYPGLFDPVPYIPGTSAADEALIDCYVNGHLTMTDSASACFVASQSEYDRIEKAANDLANGKTAESTVDSLNSDLVQPITQKQYEESNQKYSDAVDAVTNTLSDNYSDIESIDDSFNKLDGIITDIPNASLPSPAHIQLPHYTDCITLSLTDGKGRELVFPSSSQCEKINQMKSLIGYFLAGLVAMGLIWQLLTRPHG